MSEEIGEMNFYKQTLFESVKDDAKMIAKVVVFFPVMVTVVSVCLLIHAAVVISDAADEF